MVEKPKKKKKTNFWKRCFCLSLRVNEQAHLRWTNTNLEPEKGRRRKQICSKQHIICGNQRECAASREDWVKTTVFLHHDQRIDLIFTFSIQRFSLSLGFDCLSLSCLITYCGNPLSLKMISPSKPQFFWREAFKRKAQKIAPQAPKLWVCIARFVSVIIQNGLDQVNKKISKTTEEYLYLCCYFQTY